MTDWKRIAALALAKCASYDPWFPKASEALVTSWAEQIARHELDPADVLAGVTKMYADNGSGFRPLPKDLTDAARSIRLERRQRQTAAEREAIEDARDTELERRNQARLAALVEPLAEAKGIANA